MRRIALLSSGMLLVLGGCIWGNYDYKDLNWGTGGSTSSSSSSSTGSAGSGGDSTTGGAGGVGSMGGMGGTGGQVVPDEEAQCIMPDICDDGVVNCQSLDCAAQAQAVLTFGDANHQAIKALTATSSGGVVIGGNYAGTLEFDNNHVLMNSSNFRPFLAKVNGNSLVDFAGDIAEPGVITGVTVDAAGTPYGTGIINGTGDPLPATIFVRRFSGDFWESRIGIDSRNEAAGVVHDGVSRIYAAGHFFDQGSEKLNCPGTPNLKATGPGGDSLVIEFDDGGTCNWSTIVHGAIFRNVAATDKLLAVGGIYSGTTSIPGTPETVGDNASFVVVYDTSTIDHNIVRKSFLIPTVGTLDLVNVAFGPEKQSIYLTAKLKGTLPVTGKPDIISTNGGTDEDLLVAKLLPTGALAWVHRFGGPGPQIPYSLTAFNGGIYITGTTPPGMAIKEDQDSGPLCTGIKCMFLLKLSPKDGLAIRGRTYDSNEMNGDATAVSSAYDSTFWLGGGWSSKIDFNGNGAITPKGGQDLVLARFDQLP